MADPINTWGAIQQAAGVLRRVAPGEFDRLFAALSAHQQSLQRELDLYTGPDGGLWKRLGHCAAFRELTDKVSPTSLDKLP